MITCCFCNKTMEPTDKCRRLFDMDICPECGDKLARVAERFLCENICDDMSRLARRDNGMESGAEANKDE